MARYLIDGYNLLFAGADRWSGSGKAFRMEQAREQLARDVDRFCERTRSTAVVVFDGTAEPARPRFAHVEIAYAGAKESADDALRHHLLATPGLDWTLVSSDREIVAFFRKHRRDAIASERFIDLLFPPPPKRHKPSREQKRDVKPGYEPSPGEVEAWLKVFEKPKPDAGER